VDEAALRQQICQAARQMWLRGLIVGDGGLISAEVHRRRYLVTAPGRRREECRRGQPSTGRPRSARRGGGLSLDETLWKPHRFLYHIEVERQSGIAIGNRTTAIRAAVLATPPMTLSLLRLQPRANELSLGEQTLPVVHRFDEPALRAAVASGDAVALCCTDAPPAVLAVGETVWQAVNALEQTEHAATITLSCRTKA
jgi:hypothetical protein